jgi:hypothetical protein
MRKIILLCALLALAGSSSGCCRMCCWQRGGSWYNGYCYPQMPGPGLQQVPAQQAAPQQQYYSPTYAQPCVCQ